MTAELERAYIAILKEELVPATGCTEPIAIAYAAARLREVLGAEPEQVRVLVSGNIIKNVKSVIVPNTGGMKGIRAAVAAGVAAGDASRELQVIADVPEEKRAEIAECCGRMDVEVVCTHTPRLLDIRLEGRAGEHSAMVHIANSHTNVVHEERDGVVLFDKPFTDSAEDSLTDKSVLTVAGILDFAGSVELGKVSELLELQLKYNLAIAEEGLRGDWGANIGSVFL